ncbi:MAG: CotH kinase family protein [Evtepia sp.]
MSTHKHVDRICLILCLAILAVVTGLMIWKGPSAQAVSGQTEPAYVSGLFSTETVHTIDIQMEDWESFLASCENEEYVLCTAVIDGTTCQDIAIRAKGNTSLSSVKEYGNNRYSFKLEFDHYQTGGNYQGLDKLSLNNIIQDNTYMKDYLAYRMMALFGADAPLCSYAWLTVNGEDWGLYLAVEGVEESFLDRTYGGTQGDLYKPDSSDMGGGRGAGEGFQMPEDLDTAAQTQTPEMPQTDAAGMEPPAAGQMPQRGGRGQMPGGQTRPGGGLENPAQPAEGENPLQGKGGGMGSDDVKLLYTDDAFSSYSNIFDNAKTDVTDGDKTRLIASLKQLNEGTDIESVVDVDEVMRYFVVHNFVCNFDSYTGSMIHNYYLYEEDGVFSMIPWDYNLAFGSFMGGGDAAEIVNYPIDDPVSGGSAQDRPMLAWIFASEEYTGQYHQYFQDFLNLCFTSGWFEAEFDRVSALIAPYVEQDPTSFCTYEDFQSGSAALRSFCLLRAESVQGQLDGTIPADQAGQDADSSSLIQTGDLDLTAMGGASGGKGRGLGEISSEMPQNFPAEGEQMYGSGPPAVIDKGA